MRLSKSKSAYSKWMILFSTNYIYLGIFLFALFFTNCSSVKEYANSEDGKKMIDSAKETAKEKAKDKETQEKIKEIIKEKTK